MTMGAQTRWLTVAGLVSVLWCLAAAQSNVPKVTSLASIVDAMQKAQSQVRPQVSYVVIRDYRLSGANSRVPDSVVVAELDFSPPSSKGYRIQKSSGSNRGQQVVRQILDHEVGRPTNSVLDRTNYDFTYMGEAIVDGHACYVLGLTPKRKDKDLVSGQAWVDKSSFLLRRVEGDLVKMPSWWLKRIHLTLSFADVQGTWLQTSMEAVADVRIAGTHTLTSQILDYRATDVVALAGAGMRSAHVRISSASGQ